VQSEGFLGRGELSGSEGHGFNLHSPPAAV
jgi:hypothetical protein